MRSIAPGVKLLALKTLSAEGRGLTDAAAAAILRAIEGGVDIINYSVGTDCGHRAGPPPWKWSRKSDVLERAILEATAAGILFVSAAGNQGPAAGSINRPALLEDVLGVGFTDRSGQVASASSRGPVYRDRGLPRGSCARADTMFGDRSEPYVKPDLVAPGGDLGTGVRELRPVFQASGVFPNGIVSTRSAHSTWLPPLGEDGGAPYYTRVAGSSQATAVVTGLCALAIQYAGQVGLDWGEDRPSSLRNLLRKAAQRLSAGSSEAFGAGALTWPTIQALIEDCAEDRTLRESVLAGPELKLL